ncbi:DUF4123 domain-containing protein [Leisingera sp. S132]|uniref:DUF4123 domain-containing protein n=1 Tax=Leisingera sp. S132 TaxID=2867016 RepID=UPI0021A27C73|nr:DUF4123 domain-containing protein [Leisingera sp. S132]UWQ79085.1 DUF4123 domain-containing protein [Leisingera sp. S132]
MTEPLKNPGLPPEDDYWLGIDAAPAASADQRPCLHIEDIPDVEPLDAQFGAWPLKNVPEALFEPLFGQPEADPDRAADSGAAEEAAPLKTYALIDAAKLHAGFDGIRNCGLPFRCLFQGEAAKELKDAAPYLVELAPDARFTRTLFTHIPDAPAHLSTLHLWHRNPGIFIRSRADFDAVWKHFRKFTRIRDENGKWFFFRFWEAATAQAFAAHADTIELAEAMLNDGSRPGQTWILISAGAGKATACKYCVDHRAVPAKPPRLTSEVLAAFDCEIEAEQDAQDIAAALELVSSGAAEPNEDSLRSSLKALRKLGFSAAGKRQEALSLFVRASLSGKHRGASEILHKTEQGPAIRLWHLKNLVEGKE